MASDRIHCYECGKSVSSPVPEDVVIRALVVCPECIEAKKGLCHSEAELQEAVANSSAGLYELVAIEMTGIGDPRHVTELARQFKERANKLRLTASNSPGLEQK